MTDQRIKDESADHKYFTVIQRYVWAMCETPYEYTLWAVIKDVAGEKGECFLSREQLATLAMMSGGAVSRARDRLLKAGLLEGELRRDPGYPQPVWHLRIPDLWERNLRWSATYGGMPERLSHKAMQAESRHVVTALEDGSPGDGGMSPSDGGMSPSDGKKNSVLDPKEKGSGKSHPAAPQNLWVSVLGQLQPQFRKQDFETWLRDTQVVSETDGELVIGTANSHAMAWLQDRAREPAKAAIEKMAGRPMSVRFVVLESVKV